MECTLTVLCENSVSLSHGLIGEHGWAVHVDNGEHRLLFDTGQGLGLVNNSRVMGVDLSRLEAIVISHGHYDHTSGLPEALVACGGADVYIHPDAFVDRYWCRDGKNDECREIGIRYKRSYLESLGARFKSVLRFTEIFPGIYLTGEVPRLNDLELPDTTMKVRGDDGSWQQDALKDDLSLIVATEKGLTVVLGCAHAGLMNILDHVTANLPGRPLHMIIGGTHLGFADQQRFDATVAAIDRFGIKQLGASHCTGLSNCARLQQKLGDRFFFAAAGTRWKC
ncbi:MBL fold metallo-hydrolase [Desulfobulbus oligotrophicus]|jgi:7,8-dihydropterin-6-yl-methyl-4-(beta-D-ribofuranosyl)aminobenzene 5'-phosphate synthase|uniref:MBL fold metallo-hydrolase n=1 Tax=Desulfobulbus oligotrophicus TaxID=1909699 RepID=A0A7T6APY4_9BACT|nr:MBL fold metallo-hydrolase [Desulfobulbus oligotrophicus]MDY0390749.1 MBL fold metallo-hydrolase [Desulfobulbus oligotrophicus]QQG65032.1 MBL fold metallo-hydrolase [Desulfobulbus oligotrophicus]